MCSYREDDDDDATGLGSKAAVKPPTAPQQPRRHDPKMMVALLLYAYCVGVRSSREVERRCREDIAFRFIAANAYPDHATIARFRACGSQMGLDRYWASSVNSETIGPSSAVS